MRIGLGIGLDFAKKRGVLIAPVATAATSVTGTSFVANWNAYDGATTYYLDVSTSPTFATFVLQNQSVSAPATSYTVTGLTACTYYYYRVRAEGNKPTISIAPTLSPSGTQLTGTLITCGTGTWNSQGSTFNYQWKRNGVSISGATSSTYTLQVADEGTTITCEVQNQNAFGKSPYVVTSNSVSATAFDPDAQAFITAAGITNTTQKSYVNYLAVNFKANNSTLGGSLWSRLTNIKPMVGGTSSAHSYNLQNIATFQETFVNSPTHNSLGVVFNGTTQYSFCGFIPSNELTTTEGAEIIYTQNGWSNGGCAIGALNAGVRFNIFGDYYEAGTSFTLGSSPTGVGGMRSLVINGSSGFRGYVNSTQDINNITPVSGLPTIQTYLGALNFSTPYRADVTISFYAQGKVSPSDISTIYTIVQAAQTILGRNK